MAERLRSADPKIIEAAVERMERGLTGLGDLLWQLQASIAAGKRAGGVLSVEVYQGVQAVGRERLRDFQDALDSLTVGGRAHRGVGLAGTARGGTDMDV